MIKVSHNPDVLSCLANLSNDEVFTPPRLVNQMLDTLPASLWSDKSVTFLDPFTKSGVFLREIAKRLIKGLTDEIPDQQERINHIFQNQLFGIAITELTSLLARRSLYCSKYANGKYSIVEGFEYEEGNIKYSRIEHTWKNEKCIYCRASESEYNRADSLETHAYEFIHTDEPNKIFNMKFDVIVGNPPYQLSDGGGRDSGAVSLYHLFFEKAKALNPNFISLIIPARWYSGGKGLDNFRSEMINSREFKELHDFPETSDCFPGLNIRGGVCFFLWEKHYSGKCKVSNYKKGKSVSVEERYLKEADLDIFIRYNQSISILKKVRKFNELTFGERVSSRKPFGLPSNFKGYSTQRKGKNIISLYKVGSQCYTSLDDVVKNKHLIEEIKVLVSKASPGGDEFPHKIISEPIIAYPPSVCTETYLIVDVCNNSKHAENLKHYMKTKFFRFLMSLIKNTQNISKKIFDFVPIQDLNELWTDEKLFAKYGITEEEQKFIDTLIRPLD